jgi:putative transposase
MHPDPERRRRHSIRLRDYDYAQAGAYFVTICTEGRQLFFEDPILRKEAEDCWLAIPQHAREVELDEWVVMPNHLHGIIVILDPGPGRGVQLNAPTKDVATTDIPTKDAPTTNAQSNDTPATEAPGNDNPPFSRISPRPGSLAVVLRTYKAAVTTACRAIGRDDFAWQRNYYEHIIRDEPGLVAIREYICNNPLKWPLDLDNPANIPRNNSLAFVDYLRDAGLS